MLEMNNFNDRHWLSGQTEVITHLNKRHILVPDIFVIGKLMKSYMETGCMYVCPCLAKTIIRTLYFISKYGYYEILCHTIFISFLLFVREGQARCKSQSLQGQSQCKTIQLLRKFSHTSLTACDSNIRCFMNMTLNVILLNDVNSLYNHAMYKI